MLNEAKIKNKFIKYWTDMKESTSDNLCLVKGISYDNSNMKINDLNP